MLLIWRKGKSTPKCWKKCLVLKKKISRHIMTESILNVDFMRSTFLGGGAPEITKNEEAKKQRLANRKQSAFEAWKNDNTLKFKHIFKRMTWLAVHELNNYRYRYHITVNMDWRHHNCSDDEQFERIKRVLYDHHRYIKNILCIYEYGKKGKMHFHMLLETSRIKSLERDLTNNFGNSNNYNRNHNYAVKTKLIQPNKGETWEENIDRIINYFKKEQHNRQMCWITKLNV